MLVGTVAADPFRRILVDQMTSFIKANDGVTRTGAHTSFTSASISTRQLRGCAKQNTLFSTGANLLCLCAKYGAGRSVVVDRHHRGIAGNKIVKAAVAAGMKSIAVIETDGSSLVAVQRGDLDLKRDKKARELAIADNRVGELDLEWNPEVLASLNVDLTQLWNENELSAPQPKLDQAAELQMKWNTERGQIWQVGNHRLMAFVDSPVSPT